MKRSARRWLFAARKGSTDANHAQVRDALRKLGYLVVDLAGAGDGVPDLLAFDRLGVPTFIELKVGKGKLRASQVRFAERLKSFDVRHGVARTLDEALALLRHDMRSAAERNAKRTHEAIESALAAYAEAE